MTDELTERESIVHRWINKIHGAITSIATKAIEDSLSGEESEYQHLATQSRSHEAEMWKKYPNAMRAAAKRIGAPIPPEYDKADKKKKS